MFLRDDFSGAKWGSNLEESIMPSTEGNHRKNTEARDTIEMVRTMNTETRSRQPGRQNVRRSYHILHFVVDDDTDF